MRNLEKDEAEMAYRRERMMEEGFRLFSEKGVGQVSMMEVAAACRVGVATVYRYFNTKLELVLAIGEAKWNEYAEKVRKLRAEKNADAMTAGEELSFYLDFYIDLYRNHKDILRFNQELNNYARQEHATAEQLAPYLRSIQAFGVTFHQMYEKGKRDGTLKTDLPEEKLFAATAHIMMAVAVRYAQGLLFSAENEEDRTEEYMLLKRMILREYVVV